MSSKPIAEIKKPKKHTCDKCMFNTSNKRDYNRHLNTAKHKMVSKQVSKQVSNGANWCQDQKVFNCDCGKTYKYRQGYYRHKKQCNTNTDTNANTDIKNIIVKPDVVENPDNTDYKSMFLDAMSQNKEIMELLKEQSKTIQELVPKNLY